MKVYLIFSGATKAGSEHKLLDIISDLEIAEQYLKAVVKTTGMKYSKVKNTTEFGLRTIEAYTNGAFHFRIEGWKVDACIKEVSLR